MADSYLKDPIIVLTKCLLQFGFIVLFDISIKESFLTEYLAPICHPFVNRRTFFSAVDIKRFVISHGHMEELAAVSEEEEAKSDDYWKQYAAIVAPTLTLSDIAPNKETVNY